MKTNDLIDLLATGAGPAPRGVAARRLAPAAALGALASAAGALGVLGPIPMELFVDPGPWLKLAYAGGVAVGAAWLAARLGRPVGHLVREAIAYYLAAAAAYGAAQGQPGQPAPDSGQFDVDVTDTGEHPLKKKAR